MKNFHEEAPPVICQLGADQHCLTCSDEAIPVRVRRIEAASGIALVEVANEVGNQVEEVDITLVEDVVPGDLLLVHGGVAIAHLEEGEINVN
jgi:hydrogenase maturation factor